MLSVDKKDTEYEAVGIKGNKIVFTGTSKEAESYIGNATEVIDLNGRSAFPGFIESHIH